MKWIFERRGDETGTPVLCFAPAGTGATFFRAWMETLPPGYEMISIQLPGRENRVDEARPQSIEPLAQQMIDDLAPLLGRPHILLGYSMGAIVAFEIARRLAATGNRHTQRLVAWAMSAPHKLRREPRWSVVSDERLSRQLLDLGGTPPELVDVVLPIFRSDLVALERYRNDGTKVLTCPVLAIAGDADIDAPTDTVRAWTDVARDVSFATWRGSHFPDATQRRERLNMMWSWLAAPVSSQTHKETPMNGSTRRSKKEQLRDFLAGPAQGKKVMGVSIELPSPELVECFGRSDAGFLIINQEHTQINDPRTVGDMLRAAELYEKVAIVKLADNSHVAARDALDAGAFGVMLPFCDDADQLADMIQKCTFGPVGTRGICPVARATGYGFGTFTASLAEFIEFQNELALIVPQIESTTAVTNLRDILKVDRVKLLALGTVDLAYSLGVSLQDPAGFATVVKTAKDVVRQCKEARKHVLLPWMLPPGTKGPMEEVVAASRRVLEEIGADMYYGPMTTLLALATKAFTA